VAAGVLVLLALALVAPGVSASFTATTSAGISLSAAYVQMSLDDSGSAILSIANLKPADGTVTRCVVVTNTGTVPIAKVSLYAANTTGTGLGSHLNFSVLRGTNTSPPNCWAITSASLVYAGLLSGFPTGSATALDDGGGALAVGATRAYEFDVSLLDTAAAEGKSVSLSLTWTAST
jgi:hypothetical protein